MPQEDISGLCDLDLDTFSLDLHAEIQAYMSDLWPSPPIKYRKLRKPTEETEKT